MLHVIWLIRYESYDIRASSYGSHAFILWSLLTVNYHFQLRRNTPFLQEGSLFFGFFGHIGRLENYARQNSCWMKYSGHLSPVYFFSAHRSDQIWYACQMLFQLHFSLARFGPFWFIKHLVNWTKLNENDQIRIKIFFTIFIDKKIEWY